MNTAVAFIIFNRPRATERVFGEIAKARPPKLLVVADGPRPDRPGEAERCRETRAIVERVDWDCDVRTNFSEENLGVRRRISSGLDWVFGEAEEALVLEDDCLPHPTFFPFCEELLAKYRDDERVMMVSGDNFLPGPRRSPYSYYFSRYVHIWGWATWRRAWRHYDVEMKGWPELRDTSLLLDVLGDKTDAAYWRYTLDSVARGYLDTWSYQWLCACWAQNGMSVTPAVNLVSNIGYGADATNLTASDSLGENLPTEAMSWPLRHPPHMARDRAADDFISRRIFRCGRWTNHGRLARVARAVREAAAGRPGGGGSPTDVGVAQTPKRSGEGGHKGS